jgi:transcription elongation GreA/GreB family factor
VRLFDQYGAVEVVIVPSDEAAGADGARLSAKSPLGTALLDHRAGERISVETPLGLQSITILSVD